MKTATEAMNRIQEMNAAHDQRWSSLSSEQSAEYLADCRKFADAIQAELPALVGDKAVDIIWLFVELRRNEAVASALKTETVKQ